MAAPTSFIVISAVPFTQVVTQAMFNVANEQWFKYTAVAPVVLGLQTTKGGTFVPRTRIYRADGTTQVARTFTGDTGIWIALTPAGDYYLKIDKSPVAASDFDFTVTADTKPLDGLTLTAGDLLVNDDETGFAATLLDSTGAVKGFVSTIPGGEMGAILPSNVSYWHDVYGRYSATNTVAVFDATFTRIASVMVGPSAPNPPYFAVDVANTRVYVKHQAGELWTVSATAVAANTGYTFAGADVPQAMGVNAAGTVLYWVNQSSDGVIHALNLSTFTALPNLYTVPGWAAGTDKFATTPNNHPGDLFVLPNGTVVTWWRKAATSEYTLIVVSSAGALLYTYTYASPITIDHLAYIQGDSAHVLIWFFTDIGLSIGHFGRLTLATGVVDQDFTTGLFSAGQNLAAGASGLPMFGPSASCTFVRIQTPGESGGGGDGGGDDETIPPHVAPSYHLDARYIRRLRRAPHVNSDNTRVFVRRFELDLERGQGLASGQGEDPMVLLRISRDGGQTWGEESRMAAGRLGEYTSRVIARRLGHARDTVFEVVVSDPIAWSLVGAWLDLEPGTS